MEQCEIALQVFNALAAEIVEQEDLREETEEAWVY